MINRVRHLISEKAKSVREFAEMIGVKQVTLNQQISGDRKLSLDVISSILNTFNDVSSEWLLRGTGNMLLSRSDEFNENLDTCQYVSKTKYETIVSLLAEVSTDLKDTVIENKHLLDRIAELENEIRRVQSA